MSLYLQFLSLLKSAGKSSVLLDVKPWDDETDMKKLEEAVRSVHLDGLLWGACEFLDIMNLTCCFQIPKYLIVF